MTAVLLLVAVGWGAFADSVQPYAAPQTPGFTVTADPDAGLRAVVAANGVLRDPALEQAARSGLPLRIRFRTELWRDRFLDELIGQESWSVVLVHEPLEGRFTVRSTTLGGEARQFATYDEARAAIEASYALALRPTERGRYYYVAQLEVETLSLSDLEELENWLRGELRPAVSGDRSLVGAIGQGLKRAVIRLLDLPTRRVEARSPSFNVP